MPIKEQVTQNEVFNVLVATITSAGTSVGAIIDTSKYNMGVYFAVDLQQHSGGIFTLAIDHGDKAALEDVEPVPSEMLVYGTLPAVDVATPPGSKLATEGVFGTKRYVRPSIITTGVPASIQGLVKVFAICSAENIPTKQIIN